MSHPLLGILGSIAIHGVFAVAIIFGGALFSRSGEEQMLVFDIVDIRLEATGQGDTSAQGGGAIEGQSRLGKVAQLSFTQVRMSQPRTRMPPLTRLMPTKKIASGAPTPPTTEDSQLTVDTEIAAGVDVAGQSAGSAGAAIGVVQPRYPPLSRELAEEGRVVLSLIVGPDGVPQSVSVEHSSGYYRLDTVATAAAERSRFPAGSAAHRRIGFTFKLR